MKKINITLAQDAYICGGEYRLHTDSGAPAIGVLYNWYEAIGTDSDGNEYRVVWSIRDGYDIDTDTDESNACNWDAPEEVIRLDDGANVTAYAEIN